MLDYFNGKPIRQKTLRRPKSFSVSTLGLRHINCSVDMASKQVPDVHEMTSPASPQEPAEARAKFDKHGIKLEPHPSDDPNDPLNWPTSKKCFMLFILCLCAFAGTAQSGANAAGVVVQAMAYGVQPSDMINTVSAVLAGVCTGPIFAMALAHYIGRCPVILWGLLISMCCNVWSGSMTDPGDFIPYAMSRWLGGTFGAFPIALGGGFIVDMFYLHQRGKAFAFYTSSALFGISVANTVSGFIVQYNPWPVQFWWVSVLLAFCAILTAVFLEDTTYARTPNDPINEKAMKTSGLTKKLLTYIPVRGTMENSPQNTHGPFDCILIGLQPPTMLAGFFILIVFAWGGVVLNNLSVYLQNPVAIGGYGFSPVRNAEFSFVNFVSTAAAQLYGFAFDDRLPLWRCKKNGGVWRPEYRLWPVLAAPLVLSPIGLGLFGAANAEHYHFMVLAVAVFFVNMADVMCLPIVNAYVVECFVDYAAEVTTILSFYRQILGLCVNFFLPAWTATVGIRWVFGSMAFFVLVGYGLTAILEWKGPQIRAMSWSKFVDTEDNEELFVKDRE
ncbi:hypothetical protein KC351_g14043 [Hortaea werneckii]|nr:hypothetical protein KC351_g14043 [Hortaea werneckii]